ncbi:M48 family metalloprotease [Rhabdothermincola salaria]|uniref:M48 family metalloprotease n=1 Tax=Rhabdothermincola salaria TaxID=2903142 RepID=UPI001E2DAFB2|nr:M48 family metalloprotease [Rhabdothermincola salaria]MCD9624125.1 M48 family metalloprotease [Rhabdothermincola salaria]
MFDASTNPGGGTGRKVDSRVMGAGNIAKTAVLLAAIGGLLIVIGGLLGGTTGAAIGLAMGLGICGASYWKSDALAVRSAGAVPISEAEAPRLHEAVREVVARAGTPMPRVYFIDSPQPNAFATGRNPQHAVVAVTRGLLDITDRDELMGVLAHEMGHIRNRDILIGSVAAAIAMAISFVANMAMWASMFGGGGDDDSPNPFALLLMALLAPVAAGLLQMALSRSREYEADRAGAEIMGDPEPLARALLKLEAVAQQTPVHVNPAQSTAYIVNPLRGREAKAARWFMTHPPVEDRVARLRSMQVGGL